MKFQFPHLHHGWFPNQTFLKPNRARLLPLLVFSPANQVRPHTMEKKTSGCFMQLLFRALGEEIISTGKAAALNKQSVAGFQRESSHDWMKLAVTDSWPEGLSTWRIHRWLCIPAKLCSMSSISCIHWMMLLQRISALLVNPKLDNP